MNINRYNDNKLNEEKVKLTKEIEEKWTNGLKFIRPENPCRVCRAEDFLEEGAPNEGYKWFRLCTKCGVNKFEEWIWNHDTYIFDYYWNLRLFCVDCFPEFEKLQEHPLYWECALKSQVSNILLEKTKEKVDM